MATAHGSHEDTHGRRRNGMKTKVIRLRHPTGGTMVDMAWRDNPALVIIRVCVELSDILSEKDSIRATAAVHHVRTKNRLTLHKVLTGGQGCTVREEVNIFGERPLWLRHVFLLA